MPGVPVKPVRRSAVLLLSGVMLAAAACGSAGSDDPDGGAATETKVVAHEYGETQVPTDPQRVVVLHTSTILGAALQLDVPVVGYPAQPSEPSVLPFLDESELADAAVVGSGTELNLEAIAAARPDFIIGQTGFIDDQALYDRLSEIAPTVAIEGFGSTPWRDILRTVAEIFGREDRFEEGIDAYEQRVAQLREQLGDRAGSTTVTLANFRAADDIRIYSSAWCSGEVLTDVGLVRPPEQQGEENIDDLSVELLPRLDADLLIYFVGSTAADPEQAGQAAAAITSNPLWDTLGAVQRDEAHQVDAGHWFTCGSLQAQNAVLDDVERILLDSPQ